MLTLLGPARLKELQPSCYEVRVEFMSTESGPVVLASRLRVEDGTAPDKGSAVLDALVEPGVITLAMADGADLAIWHIRIGWTSCWTPFAADKRWSPLAAPVQLSGKLVAMKLGRTDEGRLSVQITDKRVGQHTLYHETAQDKLRFKAVREWVDK